MLLKKMMIIVSLLKIYLISNYRGIITEKSIRFKNLKRLIKTLKKNCKKGFKKNNDNK